MIPLATVTPEWLLAVAAFLTAVALLVGAGATAFVTIRHALYTERTVAKILPIVQATETAVNNREGATISEDVTALREGMDGGRRAADGHTEGGPTPS